MNDSTNNKKDFIKLIHSTAELNSFTTENSIEFLKSEGVNVDEIVSAGLNRIKELKSTIDLNKLPQYSYNDISKKLTKSGLDSKLVDKILPIGLKNKTANKNKPLDEGEVKDIFLVLNRVFKWDTQDLFENSQMHFNNNAINAACFKTRSSVNVNQIKAYSHYAFYLAELVNRVNINSPKYEYPGDIDEFKDQFYKSYKSLDFANLLNFTWDMGIAVIPLNDSGVFHGASWNIEDKHVIVLKQKSQSHARWIFDLLHEIYHVFVHLETQNSVVLELDEMTPFRENDSIEEAEANTFANQFIFANNAENLAKEILELSNNDIKVFKKSLEQVAYKNQMRADLLANYLAFRLQFQGENWWSTANSFQIYDPSPFKVASDILKAKVSVSDLEPIDRNLLITALEY